MKTCLHMLLLTALALSLIGTAGAHWPASSDTNFVICNRVQDQSLPKIVPMQWGGSYISWYDNSSGNYDMYLQRIDTCGVPQWQEGGICVDNHPQESWTTDYDMAVDASGNAIIALNDIRSDANRDIYAYCVSPQGQMLWGNNGITLSNNQNFEPGPRIAVLPSGNIVFAWQEVQGDTHSVVNLRKVTSAGVDVWNPPVITLDIPEGFGLSIPRIVPGLDDDVLVEYLVQTGSDFESPRSIYAQKYDAAGHPVWTEGGVAVSTVGDLAVMMFPDLKSDGEGGAYCYWYDGHENNVSHVYVQHILFDGTMMWEENGVKVSLADNEMQSQPTLAVLPGLNEVAVFYMITDIDQSQYGIGGQRLNSEGARQWTDDGLGFVLPEYERPRFNLCAVPRAVGATVVYLDMNPDGMGDCRVKAFAVAQDGSMVWPDSIHTLCSIDSSKNFLNAAVTPQGVVVAVWSDARRDDRGDIYLQNINPDGSLGDPSYPVRRTITITSPEDNSMVQDLPLVVEFQTHNFVVTPDTGDGVVNVRLNGAAVEWHTSSAPVIIENLVEGQNTVVLELMTYDHQPLRSAACDTVHVVYSTNGAIDRASLIPTSTVLLPAYPNPFNPDATITFGLPKEQAVRLTVCDILGREVARLADGPMSAGYHRVRFDGTALAAGVYFCRLQAGSISQMQKLMLLK